VRFAVGHDLTAPIRTACISVPNSWWQAAITADGTDMREDAEVAEITDLVDLSRWPDGTRAIARREHPHPGAQLTFTDHEGRRFQVFITDLDDADIAYLEALHRGRGRAEKHICDAKDLGLANLPSANFAINTAWVQLVLIAQDLLAWLKLLCLDDELARAEPKRLRYRVFHTAGIIANSGRQTRLRIAASWPWTDPIIRAFTRVQELALT
jgi:hypothetical protein